MPLLKSEGGRFTLDFFPRKNSLLSKDHRQMTFGTRRGSNRDYRVRNFLLSRTKSAVAHVQARRSKVNIFALLPITKRGCHMGTSLSDMVCHRFALPRIGAGKHRLDIARQGKVVRCGVLGTSRRR